MSVSRHIDKVCPGCERPFTVPRSWDYIRCCSIACRRSSESSVNAVCVSCGLSFHARPSAKRKYCSISCRNSSSGWRASISCGRTGTEHTEETKAQISRSVRALPPRAGGWHHTEETKAKIGRTIAPIVRKRWENPEFRQRWAESVIPARAARPNGLERRVFAILEERWPSEFQYVGSGDLIIGGKCPDFVHVSLPLLVEAYGDYWHRGEDPSGRISFFAKHGYEAVVVWESATDRKIDAAVATSMAAARCLYLMI